MPNFVMCNCTITGPAESKCRFVDAGYFKNNDNGYEYMDFDMIVPQPRTASECPPEYVVNQNRPGIELEKDRPWFNWYKWNCDNWGTKWTGETVCKPHDSDDGSSTMFTMQTAWSFPAPVVAKLGQLYPDLTFKWTYADEDIGHNCGEVTVHGDNFEFTDREGDCKFACEAFGYNYEEFKAGLDDCDEYESENGNPDEKQ